MVRPFGAEDWLRLNRCGWPACWNDYESNWEPTSKCAAALRQLGLSDWHFESERADRNQRPIEPSTSEDSRDARCIGGFRSRGVRRPGVLGRPGDCARDSKANDVLRCGRRTRICARAE